MNVKQTNNNLKDPDDLPLKIKHWGRALGFQSIGFSNTALGKAENELNGWLSQGFHGEMDYMEKHGIRRSRPAELIPGTKSVIICRMNYLSTTTGVAQKSLSNPEQGYIARYALGRDYHKTVKKRLAKLSSRIEAEVGECGHRVFSDSAPVLEKSLAEKAGLGWVGKHTNLLSKECSSWFFLGEIYTTLPLPPDQPVQPHCGDCSRCLEACPTSAIVAPYQLDARRCIAYLTIELHGSIPIEYRSSIGNRIYGCDDCQLVCPWNRFAQTSDEPDFLPRHQLDHSTLVELFSWSEELFLKRTEGSVFRRLGHIRWLRNIAVALGNAPPSDQIFNALKSRSQHPSEIVREHALWALDQHL